ncbi:MAG: TonB-dependent receptor [Methyloprofundus sp.]|nr:TonB-dependent receptor [Methyloprofundus sp.]MDT8424656.1 TonB-dependent receptor [Methyloprofundus sp.]
MKLSIAVATALALPLSGYAETEQLTTIVVEGSGSRPGAFSLAPDSTGLKDTASLLERVPGANINRNGPLTGIPQYRGMAGNRVNVSIDGANMKEVGPNAMDPSLSHVPAALTESMTVYRGIAPVSSGIDTIGGSMKVKTKKGSFAVEEGAIESDGVISSGFSSVDKGYFVSGFTSLANENHKLHLGVSKEEGNDYRYKESQNKKVSPTEYDRQALTVGYDYQRNGHEFSFNFTDNNTINTGTPALPMDIGYVKGGLYNLDYNWNLGQGYELKTKFFYQNMNHLMSNNVLRDPMMMNGAPMLMDTKANVQGGGWDIALSMPLLSGEFTTGFTGDTSHHNADMHMNMRMLMPMPHTMDTDTTLFNDVERSRYSFFGEWKGEVADKLTTELGARLTYTNAKAGDVVNGQVMTPSMVAAANNFNSQDHNKDFVDVDLVAILRYAMRTDLDLEVGFARKNRAPSYQELYLWAPSEAAGGLADGRTYLGNLDLEMENAYQFEFGIDWHTDVAYFAPRVFYHFVKDYIQGLPAYDANGLAIVDNAGNQTLQFSNIDAQLYGVDLELGYVFTDYLRFDAGLNYVEGDCLSNCYGNGNLYRIAPLNGRMQLTASHSGFTASVEGILYAKQSKVADYNGEKATPGYEIMNLRASYEPFDGFLIGTGIENVIDSTNYNHLGGYYRPMTDAANDLTQGQRIPLQGRNYYATLSYQW